jgi:hypothetical protein
MIHSTHTRSAAGLLAAALLAPCAWGQCLPAEIFGAPNTMVVGSLPLGIATGDINNDGFSDIVTANFFGNTATVLRGNGDGTFQAGTDIIMVPKGSKDIVGPVQPAIGDLNADGHNDIVMGANNQIGILLNDGKGGFVGPPNWVGLGAMIRGVVIVNFNADAFADIVFSSRDDSTLNVLLGNGDGTFQIQLPAFIAGGPVGAVVRDFNADGFLDVAAPLVFDSQVVIALGDGTGALVESGRFPADSPEWLDAGDVNNDGFDDLVTAYLNGDAMQVLLGNGDATFDERFAVSTGAGSLPITVSVVDVNADGFDDLLAGAFISSAVQVHLSNGDGTFQTHAEFPVGPRPRRFAIADFNADGAPDLAAANGAADGSATVLLNLCTGTPPCTADFNNDEIVNSQDFFDFLTAFFATAPEADFNNDKVINSQDFFDFLTAFFEGC